MEFGKQAKRCVYLVHRWTGIVMCLVMALWFISGVVMLFVGYPKLTPWERLGSLPALAQSGCCIAPGQALQHSRAPAAVKGLTLTSIRGRPHYVLQEGDGSLKAIDAATGSLAPVTDKSAALAALPSAGGDYLGLIDEDRWTHSRALNPHRPLHVLDLHDAASTRVYISSATGQIVMDATATERGWNWIGAWLHWLYLLRNQPTDPVWSWTVIVLSGIGVLSAATGLCNGIWRWRFAGRYKSGARTPYRERYMRWHHLLGLGFGTIVLTWIFSGLMSMNPVGIFDAQGKRPAVSTMPAPLPLDVGAIIGLLRAEHFQPIELEWRGLNDEPFVLARDVRNDTRLVRATASGYAVLEQWPIESLEATAGKLLPDAITSTQIITRHDRYYYARGQASMYGGNERRLPVLRVEYRDPAATWVYLDVRTGQVALSLDASQRLGRWLFNLLHSWDLPAMLAVPWAREAVLIALSLGGLLLSATGVVIGLRRLRPKA